MLKSSSHIAALFAVALLAACQAGPQTEPQPAPEAESAPQSTSTTVAAEATPETDPQAGADGAPATDTEAAPIALVEAEPEPVDVDQLAYEEAITALKSGATESAMQELSRLSQDAPDKPRLFTNLGLAHFRMQQFELAEEAFLQAILRADDDAVAHNHLGILQRRKGQFQDALLEYQRAIEINAKYARAHLNLGILFDLYLQDLEKALQQYRKYQALTGEDNAQVAGWIVDIERRLKTNSKNTQG